MATSSTKSQNRKDNSFGDYIRAARERCQLSLSEAGDLIKCSKAHIWDMERGGSRNPSIVILANMSCAYDLDLGELARMAALSAPEEAHRAALANWRDAKRRLAEAS
jgi:transcriptional regulator with XRE-family HTH domain